MDALKLSNTQAVTRFTGFLLVLLALFLSGCSGDKMSDLRAYIDEVKHRKAPPIDPIPSIKQVDTYLYHDDGRRDPFELAEIGDSSPIAPSDNGVHPDPLRRKEELEAFPLDTLRMVGTLDKDGTTWALVQAKNGTVYRVRPGNYMGQNNGRIRRITDDRIELTEIVPDQRGGYVERSATVSLGEPST